MSNGRESKKILNMLAAGDINTDQAQNLLDALSGSQTYPNSDTIVVEMAADKDNMRNVLEKLGKAIFG